jgi:hypothetical protein
MAKRTQIPMETPDGRPWNAESEAEAFSLQTGHGYRRLDTATQNPPSGGATDPTVDNATGTASTTDGGPTPPPRNGAGSGRDAWAEYAQAKGVTVDDGTSRDGIISALEGAGVATE